MDIKRWLQESERINRIMVVRKPNDNRQNMVTGTRERGQATSHWNCAPKCTIKPDDKLVPSKGQDRELPWKAMEGVLKNHCDGIGNR
ncbi:unnamed protein product [Sphenostylis stenocarpa]|uniref:Uncharacterized protein n=1 Tax=Sphenostylis stenocarpa TaxID=92480 RepID=A0AA86SFB8_9FABA|nr:unnamed protein product [Sphenostylis stenocarpa]